jgi:antitoxin VapB
VFNNGNSQAVRIPAEFRLSTNQVQISRTPEGDLLIHPCPPLRGEALLDTLAGFETDFAERLEQARSEAQPIQTREGL